MSVGRNGRVAVSANIHFRQFGDEGILLDLAKGEYYSLNPVGTRMWQALTAGRTPEEVAGDLGPDYAVDAEVLVRDCIDLVTDLIARGFLQPRAPP